MSRTKKLYTIHKVTKHDIWKGNHFFVKHYLTGKYITAIAQSRIYKQEGLEYIDVLWPDDTYGRAVWVDGDALKFRERPHWEVADGEGPTLFAGDVPKTWDEAKKLNQELGIAVDKKVDKN